MYYNFYKLNNNYRLCRVDRRTYQNFHNEQWIPGLKWNEVPPFAPYEIAILALVTLMVIFIAICILSLTYFVYYVLYTFCISKLTSRRKKEYQNVMSRDLIENGIVNV